MQSKRIEIVIVGAGIAGLSAYLFLHQHLEELVHVQIYEARPQRSGSPDQQEAHDGSVVGLPSRDIGAAVGIAPNGLAVLKRVDGTGALLDELIRRGSRIQTWQFKNARGWHFLETDQHVPDTQTDICAQTLLISRQALWKTLRDAVVAIDPNAILTERVISLEQPTLDTNIVHFESGKSITCDLLIGADGVWSRVRRALYSEHEPNTGDSIPPESKPSSSDAPDYITPKHEGLSGIGGFVPAHVLREAGLPDRTMSLTFGANGFFGCGTAGTADESRTQGQPTDDERVAVWWFTSSAKAPEAEIDSSSPGTVKRPVFDKDKAFRDLKERQIAWHDPILKAVMKHLATDNTIKLGYPSYTTPELPHWHRATTILIGDAAHALQSTSGQGTSQALEDAEALTLFLRRHLKAECLTASDNSRPAEAVRTALDSFERFRRPRISRIYAFSQRMSKGKMDMGIVSEMLMYFFIWMGNKFGLMNSVQRELHEYNLPDEVAAFQKL